MSMDSRFWSKVNKDGPVSPLLGTPCWIWTARLTHKGYGEFYFFGKMARAHRVSWMLEWRPLPKLLDHKCLVRKCVNPDHLRAATDRENQENRAGARSDNRSSGIRGVYWSKRNQKWLVQARSDGRAYYGGYFPENQLSEAEAAAIDLRNRLMTRNDIDRMAS